MSEILHIEDVAAMCHKSVPTLRWLRSKGQGPRSGLLGRRVVYRREDVEAWIETAFQQVKR
jgi:predicted DNA-binding transcriptional regulator AlpA